MYVIAGTPKSCGEVSSDEMAKVYKGLLKMVEAEPWEATE